MTNQNKHDDVKAGINPLAAVAAGAVVGAGAVIAGVVALNNDKIKDTLHQVAEEVATKTE